MAEGKTGSLEICYRVSDGGKVTNIDGAVFGIKRVTDYEGKLPSEGNKEQVNLFKLSAEETALLAEELSKGRDDWDIQGTTDKDGIIRFPDLETGISCDSDRRKGNVAEVLNREALFDIGSKRRRL